MPPRLDKRRILDAAIAKLEAELAVLVRAAEAAHEAATHEESKPEDQHDTRGLEASYLAGAQAARAAELQRQIAMFRGLPDRALAPDAPIAVGALVEIKNDEGRQSIYLLVAQGGGLAVTLDGRTIQVITPQAPVGEALLGRRAGESVEVEGHDTWREYEVISVS
jgi:transcription elongation GreA/GreB family factor